MRKIFYTFLCVVLLLSINCTSANSEKKNVINEGERLEITVSYEKQGGMGSNQYAIWIEDGKGNLIKTLFVTKFTAQGGYVKRPACVPLWLERANPSFLSKQEIDGFSGATPKSGEHTYAWDMTDNTGKVVNDGTYNFYVQGTLYGDSQVLFKGSFTKGGDKNSSISTSHEYSSDDTKNRGMITSVKAKYIPE